MTFYLPVDLTRSPGSKESMMSALSMLPLFFELLPDPSVLVLTCFGLTGRVWFKTAFLATERFLALGRFGLSMESHIFFFFIADRFATYNAPELHDPIRKELSVEAFERDSGR